MVVWRMGRVWAWICRFVGGHKVYKNRAVAAAEAVRATDGLKEQEGKNVLPDSLARANAVVAATVLARKPVSETKDDASHGARNRRLRDRF